MNITTVHGYTLALIIDQLYGLPKMMNVGVYKLGEYNPQGQIPAGHELFLGDGEGFNNWRHKLPEETTEISIGIIIRIRRAGFRPFECIGQLEVTEDEQVITLTDDHQLMRMDGIKQFQQDVERELKAARLHFGSKKEDFNPQ